MNRILCNHAWTAAGISLFFALMWGRADEGSGKWVERAAIPAETGNLEFMAVWMADQGWRVRIESADGSQWAHLALRREGGNVDASLPAPVLSSLRASARFYPQHLPEASVDRLPVLLKFRVETWSVYVDGRPVADVRAPFVLPGRVLEPAVQSPPGEAAVTRFQRTADFVFHADFMTPEGEEAALSQWECVSGNWLLHAAAENAGVMPTTRRDNRREPEPAFSPNFYSLLGQGTNAVIAAGYNFYDDYDLSASVQVAEGEAGLVFLLQDTGSCYGLTIRADEASGRSTLRLWRGVPDQPEEREILEALSVGITPMQWIKLGARVFRDRIRCQIDNRDVMDVAALLPPGGRFGLLADSAQGVRFDDVQAVSRADLDLQTWGECLRYATAGTDRWLMPGKGLLGVMRREGTGTAPVVPSSWRETWLALGSWRQAGHVVSAAFRPESRRWEMGLLLGYAGDGDSLYRFRSSRRGKTETLRLERSGATPEVIESIELSAEHVQTGGEVTLMADTTDDQVLRLYRNGEMVLMHWLDKPIRGASGVFVGPRARSAVTRIRRQAERADLFRNHFEKNRVFADDPFMRHWSSPEGDWLPEKDGHTWHKSDFFGRFLVRLPYVERSEWQAGIEDGKTRGDLTLKAAGGRLTLLAAQAGATGETVVASAALPVNAGASRGEGGDGRSYTAHYEGYWAWVSSGGRLLFRHRLEAPMRGTRMKVSGFTPTQLHDSYVECFNVKDFLFTESLHDWVINGGRWEVVNRFKCQPWWSHMNGESENGLAALWTKYEYRGDFCVEMYAGIRHGWYERAGGLNLTAMNASNSPSEGYTVTTTGWDPDFSQGMTRLYRRGVVVAESDKYLVPRVREGMKRLGYNPLLPENKRPIHGAWYYLKLRRIGSRVEFFFDNERVFAYDDAEPLPVGSLGIWTYMNSMVVARVKIAARSIEPGPVGIMPAPAPVPPPVPELVPPRVALLNHGRPLNFCAPEYWMVSDTVGRSRLTWGDSLSGGASPTWRVENLLGGGEMFAECQMAPSPCRQVAGWRFQVRSTPGARFNFHYSLGRVDAGGTYRAERRFFHRLSGTAIADGPLVLAGSTEVGDRPAEWIPVTVWLAAPGGERLLADPQAMVKVEGFGNRQPSYTVQGLTGNAPGEAYEVAEFTEILYEKPLLALAPGSAVPEGVGLEESCGGVATRFFETMARLQECLDADTVTGLRNTRVLCRSQGGLAGDALVWIRYPAELPLKAQWNSIGDAVDLLCDAPYPDRRFLLGEVRMAGQPLAADESALAARRALIPQDPAYRGAAEADRVSLAIGGQTWTYPIDRAAPRGRRPPVLVAIQGLTPFFENFETPGLSSLVTDRPGGREPEPGFHPGIPLLDGATRPPDRDPSMRVGSLRMKPAEIRRAYDPGQGHCLQVANAGRSARLQSTFTAGLSAAHFPIFRFRYRAEGMVNVSLTLNDRQVVHVGESEAGAAMVGLAGVFARDGQWHTWQGLIGEAMIDGAHAPAPQTVRELALGSAAQVDQTGLFSAWRIDDLVFGPAISTPAQMVFTPTYFAFPGMAGVWMALRMGPEDFEALTPEQKAAIEWREIRNEEACRPDVASLSDGVGHVLLKGRAADGMESQVTDIPFLLDRQPLQVSSRMAPTRDPECNGVALVVPLITLGGSPVDIDGMTLSLNGVTVPLGGPGSSVDRDTSGTTLTINWPLLLRDPLQAMGDGERGEIVLAGIRDGAGNTNADVRLPIAIDYAKDTFAPTVLGVRFPANVLFSDLALRDSDEESDDLGAMRRRWMRAQRRRQANQAARGPPAPGWRGRQRVAVPLQDTWWLIARQPRLAFLLETPQGALKRPAVWKMTLTFARREPVTVTLGAASWKAEGCLPANGSRQRVDRAAFNLDLRELLRESLSGEDMASDPVRHLTIALSGGGRDVALALRNLLVLSDWRPGEAVTVHAFDISGVSGLVYGSQERQSTPLAICPADCAATDIESGWLVLRVADRAGNRTDPMLIPIPAEAAGKGGEAGNTGG